MNLLPKKGYKTVTIKEKVYDALWKLAEKQDKSVAELVTNIVNQFIENQQRSISHGQN